MSQGKPRLWICSDMYFPEEVSTGFYMTRIAEGLATRFDVMVLCGQPSYAHQGTKAPRTEVRNGTYITRVRATSFGKDRLGLRLINVVTFLLSMSLAGLTKFRRGDVVLCVTNPPVLPPLLSLICRIKGCRFVLLVHDVFPETLTAVAGFSENGLIFRAFSHFSNFAYRYADVVVALGRDMAKLATKKGGRNVEIIENWADLDEIFPIKRADNQLIQDLGLEGKKILQYSGNIGRTHDIQQILRLAKSLERLPDWVILFAGFGGRKSLVEEAAQRPGSNIIVIPRQPRERLNELLNAADLFAIAFVPGMLGLSVPSRMYNIMAAGKPILALCDPRSELALVVNENDIGWQADSAGNLDFEKLVEGMTDETSLVQKGQNALSTARSKYRYETIIEKYLKILS
jgi:colanic acid biosynthesis glycosyl transferase WcaI